MNPDVVRTLSDPALLQARDAHFARLEALFAGNAPGDPFILWGRSGTGRSDPYIDPEAWMQEALADLAAHVDLLTDRRAFRPLVVEFGPYGVHFVDRMFGAQVYDLDGTSNWQVHYLDSPVGELRLPDLDRDETWSLAQRAASAFIESGASVPLFGLPTIASALNVALNLYGQEILLAAVTDPELVHRDLAVVNGTLCEMHRRYQAILPAEQLQPVIGAFRTQPPGFGQLCGCSTQLLSPGQYRDFIAPLDDQLLSVYPNGGMIHLCGSHTQHVPVWREMRSLRAVQLNDRAAEDLETYFSELREDQILYVNPCDGMTVERIIEITGGRRTVIVTDPGGMAS